MVTRTKKGNKELFYRLECVACGKVWDEEKTSSSCLSCGGPLDAKYDYEYIKSRLNVSALKNTPISAAKYLSFYPILDMKQLVTLGEGGTQLRRSRKVAGRLGLHEVYFKDETSNPTGGFKDRGTMVEITKAKEMGAKAVVVASTGNMAASVAAYASQAGIPAYIVVPEGTPLGKLSQTLAYGARMIQVRATYSECAKLAADIAKKYGFYLAGDYVFRGEGQKSQGYEIVEQLFWKAPDYLIAPIGCGTNIAAIFKGIKEFYELGFIDKLPKVIGVQPEGANVVVEAFERGAKDMRPIDKPTTISSAVAVSYPLDGLKVLNDIYETGGMAIDVTDEETLVAEKELASEEAIFAEPSAALPLAALKKLVRMKKIRPEDRVVCMVTGNGLKDPLTMLRILPSPQSIEPDMKEVDTFLKMKLYNIKGTMEKDKTEVLWREVPRRAALLQVVREKFDVHLPKEYADILAVEVKQFFAKTDEMVQSDLQHIIEGVLKMVPDSKKYIKVQDFQVRTSKSKRAEASVEVAVKGSGVYTSSAEGVGPVDAIMRAIRKVIEEKSLMKYWLTDFDVKIDEHGTDATVETTMGLKDDVGNKVIATATSPDIIVASVEAFERGYNILHNKRHYTT